MSTQYFLLKQNIKQFRDVLVKRDTRNGSSAPVVDEAEDAKESRKQNQMNGVTQ